MTSPARRRSEAYNARKRRRVESQSDWYDRTFDGAILPIIGGTGTAGVAVDVGSELYTQVPVDVGVSFSVPTSDADIVYTQGTRVMSAEAAAADEVVFLGRVYLGSWSILSEIAGTVTVHYFDEWRRSTPFLSLAFV